MSINRYNNLGEWKPIVFSGNIDSIQEEIRKLSDNSIIQGTLFYARTTGFNCIEFVMKTKIDLPIKDIANIDDILHIYKCTSKQKRENTVIYDCWMELSSLEPVFIETELQRIRLAVNRIGIAFRSPIIWCVKYNAMNSTPGKAMVSDEDLNYLNKILTADIDDDDLYLIEYAIDWYNQGLRATNIFTKYLCFYTSLETLITGIANGETQFHDGINKISRTQKIKCIEEKESSIREGSLLRFIQESYEECLISINRKFKSLLPEILGSNHWAIDRFFDGDNSLSQIRHNIIHGEFSLYNPEHQQIVNENLYDMNNLSREVILTLLLNLSPQDEILDWGNMYTLSMSMADPRNTMVVSNLSMLPTTDWTIKPEWCD